MLTFKKIAFHSILCAALTASVSGFGLPSSFLPKSGAFVGENGVCKTAFADGGRFCRSTQVSSLLKAVNDDQDLEVFVYDMLKMSSFVYQFNNIRNIVRLNEGKKIEKDGEESKVKFFEPALVLTDMGSQTRDDNKQLKYVITPPAILRFVEHNRKYFKEPEGGGDLEFDNTEKSEQFVLEAGIKDQSEDNLKIVDYDDRFSTNYGGLVYGVIVNLTQRWITVVFRGTIGMTDINTDRDFRLDNDSFFGSKDDVTVPGGEPGTHRGFTEYLVSNRESDTTERPYIDRILACVNGEFESNPDVAGNDFKLFVSGHSLGGGLANLFAFRAAQLKAKGDKSVKFLPNQIKAMTFASPCVGNFDYNEEFQALEKKGFLRHVRISNEGDVVPTNNIYFPFSLAIKGNSKVYTQNGVNLLLRSDEKLVTDYRNTKSMWSQTDISNIKNHLLPEYWARLGKQVNKEIYQQTLEELYQEAGNFTG